MLHTGQRQPRLMGNVKTFQVQPANKIPEHLQSLYKSGLKVVLFATSQAQQEIVIVRKLQQLGFPISDNLYINNKKYKKPMTLGMLLNLAANLKIPHKLMQ